MLRDVGDGTRQTSSGCRTSFGCTGLVCDLWWCRRNKGRRRDSHGVSAATSRGDRNDVDHEVSFNAG